MSVHTEQGSLFKITLSESKLEAYLEIGKVQDDVVITLTQLQSLISERNIKYGVNYILLQQIIDNPHFFVGKTLIIAKGQEAGVGKDGKIIYEISRKEDSIKPRVLEDGSVDHKEISNIVSVTKGQMLARYVPATLGQSGLSVMGDVMPGKKGKDVRFPIGKNVVLDNQKSTCYAAIDGLISFANNKINVFPVFEVKGDVNYHVGNIDFIGTVIIHGSVLTGFRIKSSGDIIIHGGVEGAELIAEGSIEIRGGVIASKKGLIQAGKDVKCGFIQEGNVKADGDVIVSQSIMHSSVCAGHAISCRRTKGLIVGGLLQAGELVEALTIGNTMSTATVIEVGVLPHYRKELVELKNKLNLVSENLGKTNQVLAILDQLSSVGELSQEKVALRSKLSLNKKQMMIEESDLKDRILVLEKLVDQSGMAQVNVSHMIYGGTKIMIGGYSKTIKEPMQNVSFRVSEGDITYIAYN